MNEIECVIAETRKQLDDALHVRWQVFGEEMGLFAGPTPPAPRESDCFDTLDTTIHVVAYAGGEPVATARLLLPNAKVARDGGKRFGIDLEWKFDLGGLDRPGVALAETTRFCVLRAFRRSCAVAALHGAMWSESRRLGITHWVASANTETDCMEDARIIHRVAGRMGLVSPYFLVEPRINAPPPAEPRAPFYDLEERRRAREGDLTGLRLPRTLAVFACRMGARFTGEPIYDPRFRMCSMPLIDALEPAEELSVRRAA